METNQNTSEKENIVSDFSEKLSKDLEKAAKESKYDSIRFFIAPDKNVSPESVMEDAFSLITAINNDEFKDVKPLFHQKR